MVWGKVSVDCARVKQVIGLGLCYLAIIDRGNDHTFLQCGQYFGTAFVPYKHWDTQIRSNFQRLFALLWAR